MKANDFVKKNGWKAVQHDFSIYFKDESIGTIKILTHCREYIEVDGDDLKRIIESHELVESCGGLSLAKVALDRIAGSIACKVYAGKLLIVAETRHNELKKAIADVESCQ